jgi:hypothetical protein
MTSTSWVSNSSFSICRRHSWFSAAHDSATPANRSASLSRCSSSPATWTISVSEGGCRRTAARPARVPPPPPRAPARSAAPWARQATCESSRRSRQTLSARPQQPEPGRSICSGSRSSSSLQRSSRTGAHGSSSRSAQYPTRATQRRTSRAGDNRLLLTTRRAEDALVKTAPSWPRHVYERAVTTLRWILAMIFAAIIGGGIASVVTAVVLTGGWTPKAQRPSSMPASTVCRRCSSGRGP